MFSSTPTINNSVHPILSNESKQTTSIVVEQLNNHNYTPINNGENNRSTTVNNSNHNATDESRCSALLSIAARDSSTIGYSLLFGHTLSYFSGLVTAIPGAIAPLDLRLLSLISSELFGVCFQLSQSRRDRCSAKQLLRLAINLSAIGLTTYGAGACGVSVPVATASGWILRGALADMPSVEDVRFAGQAIASETRRLSNSMFNCMSRVKQRFTGPAVDSAETVALRHA